MKVIGLLFLLLNSLTALATETWGEFQYISENVTIDNKKESIQFSLQEFYKVKLPGKMQLSALSWMDEAWISFNGKKAIFIKNQFLIEGQVEHGKYYKSSHGVTLHEPVTGGTRLIYFHNFSEEEAKNIERSRVKTVSSFSLISSAYAEENCEEDNIAIQMLKKLAPKDTLMYTVLVSGGNCATGLVNGIWNATGGIVVDIGEGAYNLVTTNPMVTIEKVGEGFESIKNFFTNIEDVLSESDEIWKSLPVEEKVKIMCEVIATTITSIGVVYLTAGTAGPVVLKSMITALESLNKGQKSIKFGKLIRSLKLKEKAMLEKISWLDKYKSGRELKAKLEQAQQIQKDLAKATEEMMDARQAAKPFLKVFRLPGKKAALLEAEGKVYRLNKALKQTMKEIDDVKVDEALAKSADLKNKKQIAAYFGVVLVTSGEEELN